MPRTVRIGLIREGKTPPDARVALSPKQCVELMHNYPDLDIRVQPSPHRSFTDAEYAGNNIVLQEDLSDCDVLLGIKEVPVADLIPDKTYLFFSHTKKAQPYNQPLMRALIEKRIRMIDYECLTHSDGQRILGFGHFAGVVGTHNGFRAWGKRTGAFELPAAHVEGTFSALEQAYHNTVLPPIKVVLTGAGKVASGAVAVLEKLDVQSVEPEDFLEREYDYPVYVHLKGHHLYGRIDGGPYHRDDLHKNPTDYVCKFKPYLTKADMLVNGVYWDRTVPRLFDEEDMRVPGYRLNVIADITCDEGGSVPINRGASTIANPVYGIDCETGAVVAPYQNESRYIDIMAVDNLPAELPRDASEHFGTHLEKYVLNALLDDGDPVIERATICKDGQLTERYQYLKEYAGLAEA